MTALHRRKWLACLALACGALTGCGTGSTEPTESLLDSLLSPLTASGTPDLWVSSVNGPPSATTAASGFFVTVTACNQGVGSTSSTVNVYLSSDTSITPADTLMGSVPTGVLHPNQCATLQVQTSGPAALSSGLRYVGALIDPANTVSEVSETNNTRAGTRMAFGSMPDFLVTRVSAPDHLPSQGFEATVEVCNVGTASGSGTLSLYLSSDASITAADTEVGYALWVHFTMVAGECLTYPIPASVSVAPGPWYVGAWVDPGNSASELREDNNTLAGPRALVGSGPELTISTVNVPPVISSTSPLTVTATVCNRGSTAAASQVELFLSADNQLTATDTLVGAAPVGPLQPGTCAPVSISGPPGVSSGQWYVGTWVDRANTVAELLEDNNTRLGGRLPAGNRPDLVVTEVSGPPTSLSAGKVLTTATVCNQGTASSPDTQLSFYLSLDASVTPADMRLGSVPVPSLQAGECAPVEGSGSASVDDGPWYLGALVDPSNGVAELLENNNARAGSTLAVGTGADLVVSRLTRPTYDTFDWYAPREFVVCNQGTAASAAGIRVTLHASSDTAITASDAFLSEAVLPALAAGQCTRPTPSGTPQLPYGSWYMGAIIDPGNSEQELLENNNTRTGERFQTGSFPDFTVSVQAPASILPGQPFTATVALCNQGINWGYAPELTFRLSADATVTPADLLLHSSQLDHLDPRGCVVVPVAMSASPSEGTWHLGAMVRSSSFSIPGETDLLDEDNIGLTRVSIGARPDLVLSRLTGPVSVSTDGAFDATATVCNQGTTPSTPSWLELNLSRDALITEADRPVGSSLVPALQPGDCAEISVLAWAHVPEGAWTLGAWLDTFGDVSELREDNNTGSGSGIAVGNKADLVISRLDGPSSAPSGQPFEFSLTVCNQGTQPSGGTEVELVFSTDESLDEQDHLAGTAPVQPLAPGQCRNLRVGAHASAGTGTWYLGALIDRAQSIPELRERDNARLQGVFAIGTGPDLTLTRLEVPPNLARHAPFLASLTVCNQGTQPSDELTILFTGTRGTLPVDYDSSSSLGSASLPALRPHECVTREVELYGIWEPHVTGVEARVTQSSSPTPPAELRTDNNTLRSAPIILGDGHDLVVTGITAPPSVQPGQGFESTLTVCNPGTTLSSGATLALHASADTFITRHDFLAGQTSVGALAVGACRSVSLQASTPPSGMWRLGAIISQAGSGELRADNNTFVGPPLAVGQGPDLIVSELRVPETLSRPSSRQVDITVCNVGTSASGSASVQLLFSTDATLSTEDAPAGSAVLPTLPASECVALRVPATVSGEDGSMYFGARIVSSGDELREDNNTRVVETVIGDGRDLAITHLSTSLDSWTSMSMKTFVTVCNQGSQPSSGGTVDVFISSSPYVTGEFPLGSLSLPDLPAGVCTTQLIEVSPFTGVIGARISTSCCGPELREDNDTLLMQLPYGSGESDLLITRLDAPGSALPGQPVSAELTVCDRFSFSSYDTSLDLFLSRDDVIDPEDVAMPRVLLEDMHQDECRNLSVPLDAPQGVWRVIGRVDSDNLRLELREDNNVRLGGMLAIGTGADLTVTQLSGPTAVSPGNAFTVTTTVCNQGTTASSRSVVGLFLSFDERVTRGDVAVGTVQLPALAPGECTQRSGSASAPSASPAPYRLGALADPNGTLPELREDNNALAGDWLGVGPGVELVITDIKGPTGVLPGDTFQAIVTVCNVGTQPAGNVALSVFASLDTTITESDTLAGTGTLSLNPGVCTPVAVSTLADSTESSWILGAIVDPSHALPELIELNNARAGGAFGVGYKADLVISEVLGPAQVASGVSFLTEVQVCNQGSVASYPEVTVVLSLDNTFDTDDVLVGSDYPPEALEPGQCTSLSIPGTAYPGPGQYQLGAIADLNNWEWEFSEENNTGGGGALDVL